MKILVTCPPMLGMKEQFVPLLSDRGFEVFCPGDSNISVEELIELVPQFDGWIIGDDPVTRDVLEAGVNGNLKGAVNGAWVQIMLIFRLVTTLGY